MIKSVTVDTGVLPLDDIKSTCANRGIDVAVSTVVDRELARSDPRTSGLERVSEMMILGESRVGEARTIAEPVGTRFDEILKVLSNGSFPKQREPATLSKGQRNQLRDALTFEAHVEAERDAFITNDLAAFVNHGRRDKLEALGRTRIFSAAEFREYLARS